MSHSAGRAECWHEVAGLCFVGGVVLGNRLFFF